MAKTNTMSNKKESNCRKSSNVVLEKKESIENPVISIQPDLLLVIQGLLVDINNSLVATKDKYCYEGKYLCVKESRVEPTSPAMEKTTDDNLIKGISGLAKYLGCCKTTAQNIVNKGVLQKAGILYRSGARIRLRKDKLERFLVENPGALQ